MKYGTSVIFSYSGVVESIIVREISPSEKEKKEFNKQVLQSVKNILKEESKETLENDLKMTGIIESISLEETFSLCGNWELIFGIGTAIS